MYSWEKSLREENQRKNPKNPSFSSTLLDEIYRSIDGYDERSHEELKVNKERSHTTTSVKKSNGSRGKSSSSVQDEEMASLKRACLIEKWMEKTVQEKVISQRKELLDNDPLFFSSGSNSSDSSSALSSSDTEFFNSVKTRNPCFATSRPKPVRTSLSPRRALQKNDQESSETEENLIKSKSRALKIYANLKKVKQPISPGGRLTSFINNLFTNGHPKKSSKNFSEDAKNVEKKSSKTKSRSLNQFPSSAVSSCSSASSFSRSCLSKNSPNSRAKLNNGAKRTVRFCPVSVIVDEDCRPCGHKRTYDQESDKLCRPPLPQILSQNSTTAVLRKTDQRAPAIAEIEHFKKENFALQRIAQDHQEEDYFDDEDEDAASDSSSDLFEIDHLALFGDKRFCEELPVYETTYLDTNRAIASGLIR